MASLRVGQKSTLCGPVIDTRYADSSRGKPTFLNIGRGYPDQFRLTVVIWGENRKVFSPPPEIQFALKRICVTGQVTQYRGVAEIEVSAPSQIRLW
jgi:DNA/RNA endonuclease YhcR with UshA esterase domain